MTAPGGDGGTEDRLGSIVEDTIDLGIHLDPVRVLLRRGAAGDEDASRSLIEAFTPRIHGLALEVTGSAVMAQRLTVRVLAAAITDAGRLSSGALAGDVAVLDLARRIILGGSTTSEGDDDVRSIVAAASSSDRTRDPREADVIRALVTMAPLRRATLERAALGRFPVVGGTEREVAARELARGLAALGWSGGTHEAAETPLWTLAALDALVLATPSEKDRLQELTTGSDDAALHRRALECAAALTLLTARPSPQDLTAKILEQARPASYTGTYDTPVLGTDSHRRQVGPPVMSGTFPGSDPAASPSSSAEQGMAPKIVEQDTSRIPEVSFRPGNQAALDRSIRRGSRRTSWRARVLLAALLLGVLALGGVVVHLEQQRAQAVAAQQHWARISLSAGATSIPGRSDNGTWTAMTSPEGTVLVASGVTPYDGEVLQLWAEDDGAVRNLGVLDVERDGHISYHGDGGAQRLFVTREHSPGAASGSPSSRVVADLSP